MKVRLGLVLVSLALLFPAAASAGASDFCTDSPAPCVESATRDGGAVTAADPDWDIFIIVGGDPGTLLWGVQSKTDPDPYELGAAALDDDWVITFDIGTVIPRVAFMRGTDVDVTRHDDGDGTYRITIAATPVTVAGECDQTSWPWTCPDTAQEESDRDAYLDGQITDYSTWDNVEERNAFTGMDFATNVAATSIPPELEPDPTTGNQRLLLRLANPHFRHGGLIQFTGHVHLRIPNRFFREVYGIDAPGSMVPGSLDPTVGGPDTGSGTVTVTQEPGGDAMIVDITGMTFSARPVRIKVGTITPTKPTNIRAERTARTRGKVRFAPAMRRGSKIIAYQARCVARQGKHVVRRKRSEAPIYLRDLRRRVAYDCRVRAISLAGKGRYSVADRMPANP